MIIPSIDLMNGKAVQLVQGNPRNKIVEVDDVIGLAKEYRKYGEIAVIDLDAAFGKRNNLILIKKLCRIAECRVGGGIRTKEKAEQLLRAGAKKIIIGTSANKEFLQKLPKERIIVALDSKNGKVVNKGWTSKTEKTPIALAKELEGFCSEFLYTIIDKEGLMKGIDFNAVKELLSKTKNKITFAGGITTIADINKLENLNVNSQIGMALYTKKLDINKAFVSLIDFKKQNALVPTIVQDYRTKQVLMLAYSTKESLLTTLKINKAVYYSRSRKKLWQKGETSGNYQEIVKIKYDCDRDTLLFIVNQKNNACHTGNYSCFGRKDFGVEELYDIIVDRMKNPKPNSYTSKILKSEKKIKEKISEESKEVVNYKDKENLVWEIADLTYFVSVLMAKKGIKIEDIKRELEGRRR